MNTIVIILVVLLVIGLVLVLGSIHPKARMLLDIVMVTSLVLILLGIV